MFLVLIRQPLRRGSSIKGSMWRWAGYEPVISIRKKGMEISLAISLSIVEAHEDQLSPENNPDFGGRFTFKLPLAKNA
jgi:signal transduction histidine kinase